MRRGFVIATSALALASTGCAAWDSSARARERATEVLHCEQVELESRGESAWRATGCGNTVDVACTTAGNEPDCIPVRMRTAGGANTEVVARAEANTDVVANAQDEAVASAAVDVRPGAGNASAEPTAAGGASPEAGPEAATDAPLRALLDARRDDVLACASRDRIVVRATWDIEGAIALVLGGDLAGSPEEGCVAALFGDVRAPRGAPGVLLHLVRR